MNPNIRTTDGNTPLHAAALWDRREVAMILFANGRPDAANNHGETPLYLAAQGNNKELATVLLANRANPNKANKAGTRPIDSAVDYDLAEIVELRVKYGANQHVAGEARETVLCFLARKRHQDGVLLLLGSRMQYDTATPRSSNDCRPGERRRQPYVRQLRKQQRQPGHPH